MLVYQGHPSPVLSPLSFSYTSSLYIPELGCASFPGSSSRVWNPSSSSPSSSPSIPPLLPCPSPSLSVSVDDSCLLAHSMSLWETRSTLPSSLSHTHSIIIYNFGRDSVNPPQFSLLSHSPSCGFVRKKKGITTPPFECSFPTTYFNYNTSW